MLYALTIQLEPWRVPYCMHRYGITQKKRVCVVFMENLALGTNSCICTTHSKYHRFIALKAIFYGFIEKKLSFSCINMAMGVWYECSFSMMQYGTCSHN